MIAECVVYHVNVRLCLCVSAAASQRGFPKQIEIETLVNGESHLSDALAGLSSVEITQAADSRDSVQGTSLHLFASLNVQYCGSILTSPDLKNAKNKTRVASWSSSRCFCSLCSLW